MITVSRRSGKTIQCFEDIRKYLFEHKVEHLAFIRDGKLEIVYTQKYIDNLHKAIKEHLEYIISITDDERVLAECNLIEEELEIEK